MGKYQYPQSLQGKYAKAFMLSADAVPGSSRFQKKRDFEVWLSKQNLQFLGGETNAPARLFPLRHAAVAAGMGIFRKNNFFYGPKGSYYELDGYLISEDCLYKHSCTIPPCSDTCTICQRACRTKALSAPYTMDPLSCISFWTTFGQGNIPPHLKEEQFSTWICGCDACQDACPYNRHDWSQGEEYPEVAEIESLLQPENILQASDAVLREKVIPKTEYHILPDQVQTLKISAARALKYIHAASDNG